MESQSKEEHEEVAKAARVLREHRSDIVLSGRIVDGKVELDEATLREIGEKFAGANRSFVAVNAPFDPTSPTA